jgi:hypothetical protein
MVSGFFQRGPSLSLNLAKQSQVWIDMIQCCMMGWTYLKSSLFVLFASNLELLVIEIPEGIFSQLYFYKGKKVKAHAIS